MTKADWQYAGEGRAPEDSTPAAVPFELEPLNLPAAAEQSATPEADLDLRGQSFPLPILVVHRKLCAMPAGDVLRASCDTLMARENFTAYAKATGSLVEFDQFATHLIVKLRRKPL